MLYSINVFPSADLINLSMDLNRREGICGTEVLIDL
jgi:hypothetical protein